MLLGLAACGFQPLYAARVDGRTVQDELAQTYILPIAHRQGQILYNYLRDRIVPHGQPTRPKYVLWVELQASRSGAVVRRDATASRYDVRLIANYELRDARTNAVLTHGRAQAIGSYNVRNEPYPTLVAELDVRERVARDLSDEIRNRIAVYVLDPTEPALAPGVTPQVEAVEPHVPGVSNPELDSYTR